MFGALLAVAVECKKDAATVLLPGLAVFGGAISLMTGVMVTTRYWTTNDLRLAGEVAPVGIAVGTVVGLPGMLAFWVVGLVT